MPEVMVPAEMVFAVVPSVVSTPVPLIENEEPMRSALVTAPPTCSDTEDMILWVRSALAGIADAKVMPNTKSVRFI